MSKNRNILSVSFSKKDRFEMQLLKHAETYGIFSKYVKRLIQRDMENSSPIMIPVEKETVPIQKEIEKPPVRKQVQKQQEVSKSISNRKATSFI
ncbi:hypothetical protein COE51_01190 [Bacillus pseudomycoides]|nr:hypothetical protein COE51_01190 [Bacillus pseudomycoides]